MGRRITIRPFLADLFEHTDLIINYAELSNGGFDLSVRYDCDTSNDVVDAPKSMNEGLEALEKIKNNLRLFGFDEDTDNFKLLNIIEKELKGKEELRKAFDVLSKGNEEVMEELSKEIEKNEVLEIIKDKIVYRTALNDRTKNPDNDLIRFEIKGLVDKETWLKIYEVFKGPVI